MFLTWILVGAVAGWLASIIMHTNQRQGCILNIIVGFIGGFVVGIFGGTGVRGFNLWSIFVALAGSVILLWLVKKISGPKGR